MASSACLADSLFTEFVILLISTMSSSCLFSRVYRSSAARSAPAIHGPACGSLRTLFFASASFSWRELTASMLLDIQ